MIKIIDGALPQELITDDPRDPSRTKHRPCFGLPAPKKVSTYYAETDGEPKAIQVQTELFDEACVGDRIQYGDYVARYHGNGRWAVSKCSNRDIKFHADFGCFCFAAVGILGRFVDESDGLSASEFSSRLE